MADFSINGTKRIHPILKRKSPERKMKLDPYLILYTKIHSSCLKTFMYKSKTKKIFKGSIVYHNLGVGNLTQAC